MHQQCRFHLRDAILLCMVAAMLFCLAITGCDDRGGGIFRRSRRMTGGSPTRGIQQALVLYSQSNNGYYPGYNADGSDDFGALAPGPGKFGSNALSDDDIGKIYVILLNGEFFTQEYIIASADSDPAISQAVLHQNGTVFTNANYSYAMLDMNDAGSNRRNEWKDTNSALAPMIADPSSDIRPLSTVTYHSDVDAAKGDSNVDYQGNIAWNDNHVTFETSAVFAPGKLKMGDTPNAAALNPFKNKANHGAKLIW